MKIRTSGMSVVDRATEHHTQFPWEDFGVETVQGGSKGRVFVRRTNLTYTTAFVEVCDGEVPFIRGEGPTVADAEVNAWEKFQKIQACVEHKYEPRGYTNGLGWCVHCGVFESGIFTAEQLGQFCHVCGVPTFDAIKDGFSCPEHHPGKVFKDRMDELSVIDDWTDEQDEEYWDLTSKYTKVSMGLDPEGDWS